MAFQPGQSGNPGGKPKGRKNLEREFFEDMYASWKVGGKDVIERVKRQAPAKYLAVVANLMPKQIDVKDESAGDRERTTKLLELVTSRLEELASPSDGGAREAGFREPSNPVSPVSKAN